MCTSCTRCWYKNTSCVERGFEKLFYRWGLFVANHPCITIIASLILAGSLSVFMIFMETETKTELLYAPKGTTSYDNFLEYKETWEEYEDRVGMNNIIVFDKSDPSKNILTMEYLTVFLEIYENITAIEINYDGEIYKYEDICYKYENGNCQTQSILELYDYDQQIFQQEFGQTPISYPVQSSDYSGQQLFIPLVLGQNITTRYVNIVDPKDFSPENYAPFVSASPALQMIFTLDLGVYGDDLCNKWYQQFINTIQIWSESDRNQLFSVSYSGYNSFEDELARAVASDVVTFVTSFVLLGLFSTLMILRFKRTTCCKRMRCYKLDKKRCRGRIAWVGTVSAMMAVGASFGVVGGIMGIKFNSIASMAPFLLVGLGLDDMFVLLRAYELTPSSVKIESRIALTMERGGISIMFTSITDLMAFSIGAVSPFGAISAFCVYCGVGVFFDFLFQISFFLAFMVYDSRIQQDEGRSLCCNCCLYLSNASATKRETNSIGEIELAVQPEHEPTAPTLTVAVNTESSSWFMNKLGAFLLYSWKVKAVVILIFVGYLIGATVGILSLTAYTNPEDLAANDSYLRTLYGVQERYFNSIGPPVQFILDKPLDYSDKEVVKYINELTVSIQNDECFLNDSAFTTSWVHSYYDYLELHHPNHTMTKQSFYDILYNEYLISDEGARFIQDIWDTLITQNDVETSHKNTDLFGVEVIGKASYEYIERSRIWLSLKPTDSSTFGVKACLDNFRKLQNQYQSELGTYYYSIATVFAESDLITIKQTTYNLLYAGIAASIISMILIPYPLMAIIVMLTVAQILYGVMGYMSLWGLPINTTTMINIVLAVGFSVDNAAHFCHAFMNAPMTQQYPSKSDERRARVIYALNAVGMPILAGDCSTIVALLPLATAESEIFVSFWKCISLVMIFGIAHAMLYLPVLLSIIGPLGFDNIVNENDGMNEELHLDSDPKVYQKEKREEEYNKSFGMLQPGHTVVASTSIGTEPSPRSSGTDYMETNEDRVVSDSEHEME